MASMIGWFVLCQVVLFHGVFAIDEEIKTFQAIVIAPENVAVIEPAEVVLKCHAYNSSRRIQWYEYVTGHPEGLQISDLEFVLPGHPTAYKYQIIHIDPVQYDLQIITSANGDGGKYECRDASAPTSSRFAQVIILMGNPTCTSTVPANGVVLENSAFSAECTIYYHGNVPPFMSWSGPSPYNSYYQPTPSSAVASVSFTAVRTMTAFRFRCLTNFTEAGFNANDSATNAPTYQYTYNDSLLIVSWGPKNLYYSPLQPSYTSGDAIICRADSRPTSNFTWMNMVTFETTYSTVLELTDAMIGTTLMRCTATNYIQGSYYTANLYSNITVTPKPTTPAPTTVPTTPKPLPWDVCDDLTGQWTAYAPSAFLCLNINQANQGVATGVLRNGTDQIYIGIIGRTAPGLTNQVGFTGIWPTHIGTASFAGICTKCYGEEVLRISAVKRSIEHSPNCGVGGTVMYLDDYLFYRTGPACGGAEIERLLKIGRETI